MPAILSAALNGKADIFITGDNQLFDLQKVKNMGTDSFILFWETLKGQAKRHPCKYALQSQLQGG
jgi:predicted nucleic acid-binding protein